MTTHLSARLAWHMDGWEGRPCRDPESNTYCAGAHSYPGEMIAEQRQVVKDARGRPHCSSTKAEDGIPPCIYGMNAFGTKTLKAYATPPEFFRDNTETRYWDLPPATVSVWPYEVMYGEDVQKGERSFDYVRRLENARQFFAQFEPDRSLVFYYANYSNPFSEGEVSRYVVVGVSRLKQVGDILFFQGCSDRVKEKYAGGFVWQMNVTSHYPDQGLRIPYHLYHDKPEVLSRLMFVPDNPRNCKYAAREVSDDDALGFVERFIELSSYLKEIGDTSEDWDLRTTWLQSLVSELWRNRGLYPGLPAVLESIKFGAGVPYFRQRTDEGQEKQARDALFALVEGKADTVPGIRLEAKQTEGMRRAWKLRTDDERRLLRDVLPRIDLAANQVEVILSQNRESLCSLTASPSEIEANPYLLCEQYVGVGPDDTIGFGKVDRGMLSSPELGASLAEVDDRRRLRALCVERLSQETVHTFRPAGQVIAEVNRRLEHLPEWKRHRFSEQYLSADADFLSEALTIRSSEGTDYLYLKTVFEDERELEKQLRALANRGDIRLRSPVTEANWHDFLYASGSKLAEKRPDKYESAIAGQVQVCQAIFARPLAVLGGEAGTGKTTAIKAIIAAIEKAHGSGTSFQILAPTGKAADRIRAITGKSAATIHSFLAARGWLNDNLRFKRSGGQRADMFNTYIIDEASMVDLQLMAALFRAINWNSVQRLILVGDPNQLPPIGRGRVFSDVIDWLKDSRPESVGLLHANMRQMENQLEGKGTTMLELASLYVRRNQTEQSDEGETARFEEMMARVQQGGDVDRGLRVLYWTGAEELKMALVDTIVSDMEADSGVKLDPERAYELWRVASSCGGNVSQPDYQQVISPYRAEEFGTDSLNTLLQKHAQGAMLQRIGTLGGVTLFDKVIQFRNRGKSDSLSAYNSDSHRVDLVEVYNGELGFVKPHGFDGGGWKGPRFWFKRLQVVYARKPTLWVNYGTELGNLPDGRFIRAEKVEDNLELAYAISVHKAQGSEFQRVYFVVPKHKRALLSRELFYTGLTRATRHCTLLVEEDIAPLLSMHRPEGSHLSGINSSLFEFTPVPDEWLNRAAWYEEGKIHRTLAAQMVRSKSEVIIANILFDRDIPFQYEVPLYAPDGTFRLPDFTLTLAGEPWYWEHLGMMDQEAYRRHWDEKLKWYKHHGYSDRLIVSREDSGFDSAAVIKLLENVGH